MSISSSPGARRNALLLEAIVGLGLTALLLTTLLTLVGRVQRLKPHEQLDGVWTECALQQRLSHIVTQITAILHMEDGELICRFDNQLHSDPHFCGEVLAHIACDSHQRLVATIWPSPDNWKLEHPPYYQAVLGAGIGEVSWVEHHRGELLPAMLEVHVDERSLLFPIYAAQCHPEVP